MENGKLQNNLQNVNSKMENIQKVPNCYNTVKKKFSAGFRWSLWGSITYELIKTFHYFLLLMMLDTFTYGLVGSIFSIIYFTTKLADIGSTYSLPPFFHLFFKSRASFKRLFFNYFFLPQLPIISAAACISTSIYYTKFTTLSPS